jgi:hypothetical protein
VCENDFPAVAAPVVAAVLVVAQPALRTGGAAVAALLPVVLTRDTLPRTVLGNGTLAGRGGEAACHTLPAAFCCCCCCAAAAVPLLLLCCCSASCCFCNMSAKLLRFGGPRGLLSAANAAAAASPAVVVVYTAALTQHKLITGELGCVS